MRSLMCAAGVAAVCLMAGSTGVQADGWGDSTIYRNTGWANATPDPRSRLGASIGTTSGTTSGTSAGSVTLSTANQRVETGNNRDRSRRAARASRPSNPSRVASGSVGGGSATTGIASFYWQPQRVASGGWFNPNAMTAAHRTLPFGTRVRVTHLANGRSVDVTINDRGPFIAGRIIDLSRAAAQAINMTSQGIARVQVTVLGR